jgi:hypothetical protein
MLARLARLTGFLDDQAQQRLVPMLLDRMVHSYSIEGGHRRHRRRSRSHATCFQENPNLSVATLNESFPIRGAENVAHWTQALVKAGLPN